MGIHSRDWRVQACDRLDDKYCLNVLQITRLLNGLNGVLIHYLVCVEQDNALMLQERSIDNLFISSPFCKRQRTQHVRTVSM